MFESEWGGGGAHQDTECVCMGAALARAPSAQAGAPTTLSLGLNTARTTSYGCGPLVTPPCYDDEVCSEFQLLELPDRLCSSVRPSEYQPASTPLPFSPALLSFSSLWKNEEVVGAHRPALERETSERTAAPVARRRRRRLPTTSPNHRLSLSSTSCLRPNCLSLDRPLDHPHQQKV